MVLVRDIALSRAPLVAFAAMGLLWGGFAASVPELKAGIGAGDAAFGGALFAASAALVVAMWLAPRAEARLGAAALPLAAAAMGLAFLTPGLAGGVAGFALAMGLCALASGTLDVLMNARISGIETRSGRELMNLNHAIFSLAYMVAALATGVAREIGLGPAAILTALALAVLAAVPLMRAPMVGATAAEGAGAPAAWGLLSLLGGAVVFAAFTGEHAVESWSALHLERELGGGAAEGAAGPALLGFTMFVGRMSGQVLSARLGARRLIGAGAVLAAAGSLGVAAAPGLAAAYAGFAALGLGLSVMAPTAMGLVGRGLPDDLRVAMIARVSMVGFMGFFVGPPLMGGLSALFGLRWAFVAIAVLLLVVPLLLPALGRATAQPAGRSQSRP
ncbi:MFS transporter [Rhodobacteraceae bacterium CCMM004]|nr:MFS transporter [Rhodobacteraceae bacterium CCMM004]